MSTAVPILAVADLIREVDWPAGRSNIAKEGMMSDPRGFDCPATDRPCTEHNCNYKATGYCIRHSQEDLEFRRAQAENERKRLREEDRLAEEKRRRKHRKELSNERLRRRMGPINF